MAKKREFVGLYITPSRIEAAYFADEEDRRLTAQGHVDIPEGVFDDEGEIADPGQLADLLKELWQEAGFKVWKAVVVLGSRKAIMRLVKLPHMPEDSLQQTVLSEAEQFALFRKEEPLVHFFIADPEGEFISVCFGAISADVVKQYNDVCKMAGVKLLSVDLVQLAGQRGFGYWYPPDEDYWTGVMVLQQRLIVSFWKDARLQNIREILLPDRERISMDILAQNYIPEITRTLSDDAEFFDDPHLIVGCDDLEAATDLAVNIQTYFNFPARVAGPGEMPAPSPASDDEDGEGDGDEVLPVEVSYVAIGAALWGDRGVVQSFNLTKFASRSAISGPFRAAHMQRMFANTPILPVVGVVVALLISAGGMFAWQATLNGQIARLKDQVQSLGSKATNSQMLENKIKPNEAILAQWLMGRREHDFAEAFVGKLRDIIPADTWLYSLDYDEGNQITVSGAALHQDSPLRFADQLASMPEIDNPRVRNLIKVGPYFKFEIFATLLHDATTSSGVTAL